jgi:amidophosphoribosyltransferase
VLDEHGLDSERFAEPKPAACVFEHIYFARIRMKLNPLREVIAGKRVVVIDDSIVRGNTTQQIVAMLRDAGAREVHMRISSPPIRWPCFYGIDMPDQNELIGATMEIDDIKAHIGADSLDYLTLDRTLAATEIPADSFCTACFSSKYPVPIPAEELRNKQVLENPVAESPARWQPEKG